MLQSHTDVTRKLAMIAAPCKRDQKGRFTNGNPSGPGRRKREVEREYLEVMISTVSHDDWATICWRGPLDEEGRLGLKQVAENARETFIRPSCDVGSLPRTPGCGEPWRSQGG